MYKVEIADKNYWLKQIKCQWGCPVRTDSRGYVLAIADKNYLEAYKIARRPNPFASICGRVCGAPCEIACRRGDIDESVTIRALKRFVTEQYGVEAQVPANTIQFSEAMRDNSGKNKDKRIAIIGAGVGGLTAAHDLALLGYQVTVFEADAIAGGMLVTGVPLYRLPRDLVQQEIDAILSLGVELKLNTAIGDEISMAQLRKEYDAVLIAVGLQKSRKINLEGGELDGVLQGIEFLKLVNLGEKINIGEKVIIIGGGNVAFDVARTAVRKQSSGYKADAEDFYEAGDAARTAIRLGAKEVHLVCLESLEEMPADNIEIEEGVEEGVVLHTRRGPDKIIGKDGKVNGLQTKIVRSVFGEDGRFNPTFESGEGEFLEADTVIMAIGQSGDYTFLKDLPELKIAGNGIIEIDPATKATSVPGIYACGDVADGAKLFIDAIRSGQVAAASIDEYINKKRIVKDISVEIDIPLRHEMPDGHIQHDRENPEVIDADDRRQSEETIEINYEESVAGTQGARCVKCHINTIFEGGACILCNGCVDVCPTHCLKLISLAELELDDELKTLLQNYYGIDLAEKSDQEIRDTLEKLGSAMIKNETLCIRCGYCAKRCPTEAVRMEHFTFNARYRYEDDK